MDDQELVVVDPDADLALMDPLEIDEEGDDAGWGVVAPDRHYRGRHPSRS
jgi:hypothetical protein